MNRRVDATLRRSPVQPVFRWRAARRLAVLAYHAVEDEERFAAQLDEIRSAWHAVTLDDVVASATGRAALPRRAVLITFDDADRSLLERGVPLLRERGLPAAAFVVAGLLDGDRGIWTREAADLAKAGGLTDEVPDARGAEIVRRLKRVPDDRRLAAMDDLRKTASREAPPVAQLRREDLPAVQSSGVAVGNHSMTHPILPMCSDAKVLSEIRDAHEVLMAALGEPPRAFAYPNGDWDERTVLALQDLGYRCAFTFDHRHSEIPPRRPLVISRLWVNSTDPLDRFRIVLSGLQPALYRFRRVARRDGERAVPEPAPVP